MNFGVKTSIADAALVVGALALVDAPAVAADCASPASVQARPAKTKALTLRKETVRNIGQSHEHPPTMVATAPDTTATCDVCMTRTHYP